MTRVLFAMDIDYRASIQKNVMFIHGMGLTIGKNAVIKEGVKLYQGVTIGGTGNTRELDGGKIMTQPVIGRNSTIYTNSCVLGPVIVGDNVKVGACSLVLKDIPANTVFIERRVGE